MVVSNIEFEYKNVLGSKNFKENKSLTHYYNRNQNVYVDVDVENNTNQTLSNKIGVIAYGTYDEINDSFYARVTEGHDSYDIPPGTKTISFKGMYIPFPGYNDIIVGYGVWQHPKQPSIFIESGILMRKGIFCRGLFLNGFAAVYNTSDFFNGGVCVNPGEEFLIRIDLDNTTQNTQKSDFYVLIGHLVGAQYEVYYDFYSKDVSIGVGIGKQIYLPCTINEKGHWDILVANGIYNGPDDFRIDDYVGTYNQLVVK